MRFKKKWVLRAPEGDESGLGGGGGGGGETPFDIESAVTSIGDDLGFNKEPPKDGEGPEHKDDPNVIDDTAGDPPAPPPPPAPAPPPAAPTPPPPAPAPAPGTPPARFTAETAPTTWSAAASQQWATLPQPIREEIAKRENDMFRGLEQYRSEAGFAREVKTFLAPLANDLQRHNVAPQAFLGNLINAHLTLASPQLPPEQKLAMAQQLLKTYGIALPQAAADDGTPAYVDPEVKELREQLSALQSKINESEQRTVSAERQKLTDEITAFANDPAHPHFNEVAEDIAAMIRGAGGQLGLKEAYERAVWANPVTRAKEIATQEAAAVEKAQKEAKERAEAARKATSARVRTSGHQGGGTAVSGSMEDTMQETLAAIRAKSK